MKEIKVGSKVCYSKKFLRSIGEGPRSDLWRVKGEVTGIVKLGEAPNGVTLAEINWTNVDENFQDCLGKVNVRNLAVVGSRAS